MFRGSEKDIDAMHNLEAFLGKGFADVTCEEQTRVVIEDEMWIRYTVYLFSEAGPYRFYYPAEAEYPFFVTRESGRSAYMLVAPASGPRLLSLKAHPHLHGPLITDGFRHYVDDIPRPL